jgi:hypothetical protein
MGDAWTPTLEEHLRSLLVGSRYEEGSRSAPDCFESSWEAFADWPPNVFAFTWTLLDISGLYRLAVSPPGAARWPPDDKWVSRVRAVAADWRNKPGTPPRIQELGKLLSQNHAMRMQTLGTADGWAACSAILELHATADEASAGVGIPGGERDAEYDFLFRASWQLADQGTLARLPAHHVRVLPKLRTPQSGITIRSLSHHLAAQRTEVKVLWDVAEICSPSEMRLNLIVLPWPDLVEPNAFRPARAPVPSPVTDKFGYFAFEPQQQFDVDRLHKVISEAKRRVGRVHGVVLPESAVTVEDVTRIQDRLRREDVPMLVAGVRGPQSNYAHLGLYYNEKWQPFRQDKHHRWFLDGPQIQQYHLGASLHPSLKWWEDMNVEPRCLRFVTANGWLTICHLICEDLARQEPVGELVRAVGPNLVIALLLDGPQLRTRWPARYASVLADDPGSSVLTVTSIGMAMRAWSSDYPPSRVVALWKDPRGSAKEIVLPQDHCALLLTLTAHYVKEFAADTRDDGGMTGEIVLSGVEAIAAP